LQYRLFSAPRLLLRLSEYANSALKWPYQNGRKGEIMETSTYIKTVQHRERAKDILAVGLAFLISIAFAIGISMLTGCSDSDDDDKKPSAADVQHCKDTVDAMDICFGFEDSFGMTVAEAKNKCSESMDESDHCAIKCENDAMDCDEFADCLDGC
jgi:hypothetical protein